MAIYKAKIQSNYVQIPNATAQDNRLSYEARGMLSMLLSMPEDWAICKEWLIKQSDAGRDKVQRILTELVTHGYMRKSQKKNDNGQFVSNDYYVFSSPVDGLAVDGFSVNGKTPTTKETALQKKQLTKNGSSNEQPPVDNSKNLSISKQGFEYIWEVWKDEKKAIGKKDTSAKTHTFEKNWKKLFNTKYFNSHTTSEFEKEIADIGKSIIIEHSITDFNPTQNMQLARFLTLKKWRDDGYFDESKEKGER